MLQWKLKQLRCIRGNGLGVKDQPQEEKIHFRSPATQCKTEEIHPPIFHTQSCIATFFSFRLMLMYYIIHNKSYSAQFGINRKSQDMFSIET